MVLTLFSFEAYWELQLLWLLQRANHCFFQSDQSVMYCKNAQNHPCCPKIRRAVYINPNLRRVECALGLCYLPLSFRGMVTLFYLRFKIHRFDWKLLNYSAFYAYCCLRQPAIQRFWGLLRLLLLL